LIEQFLGILGRCFEGLISEAIEASALAGEQAESGVVPNAIEIGGQGVGFRPGEGEDSAGGQSHAAHLGDVVNRGREKYRRGIHGTDFGRRDRAAPTPGMDIIFGAMRRRASARQSVTAVDSSARANNRSSNWERCRSAAP